MVATVLRRPDCLDIILEDDLVRRLLERLKAEPLSMPQRPVLSVRTIDATVTEQKGKALLPRPRELGRGVHARPHQVADRFVHRIGHPDTGQIAGAVLSRQFLGITSVGLDPLSWLAGDQARRNDRAAVTQIDQLSIDAVAASAGLIAELQPIFVFRQLFCQFGDVGWCIWDIREARPPRCVVRADFDRIRKPGRCEFLPARLSSYDEDGTRNVEITASAVSHRVALLAQADGLLLIPSETHHIQRGDMLEFLPFSDG